MDINTKINEVSDLIKRAEKIRDEIKTAFQNTQSITDACAHFGVNRVSIGKHDEELKDSKSWPFSYSGNIFLDGREGNWPKAWAVAAKSGMGLGGGNAGQHQIEGPVIDGIYESRDGKWLKVR